MKALYLAAACMFLSLNLSAAPKLGLQSWTCRNLSFEQMVDFAKEHGIDRVQLYRTHVNPAHSVEVNRSKLAVLREHGIVPYSMYAAAGRSPAEDRQLFELARLFGMTFLVVEPVDQSAWPRLLTLAREHGLKLAVHNHGRETTYGDPATVRDLLAQYGEELGVCLDVGWVTAAGFDAAEVFRSYGKRVLDLHLKDKRISGEEGAKVIEDTMPGEGQVNFKGLFQAIRESGWSGTMAIETDSKDFAANPGPLVKRSKAFVRSIVSP